MSRGRLATNHCFSVVQLEVAVGLVWAIYLRFEVSIVYRVKVKI